MSPGDSVMVASCPPEPTEMVRAVDDTYFAFEQELKAFFIDMAMMYLRDGDPDARLL
jgi:hypothetical protein